MKQAPQNALQVEATDDQLMQLAARGGLDAYELLVRRHQGRLRAYCTRWCGSASAGDDVAQECFVELWQRRASYVGQGRFKSYLFRIAANRCKNHQRRVERELRLVSARLTEEPAASVALPAATERARVQRALEQLPSAQREALLLRYSAELDYAAIAELLGAPEATLRSRVFLGLMKLRRLLGRRRSR